MIAKDFAVFFMFKTIEKQLVDILVYNCTLEI